jgi:pectate lyase-like protein
MKSLRFGTYLPLLFITLLFLVSLSCVGDNASAQSDSLTNPRMPIAPPPPGPFDYGMVVNHMIDTCAQAVYKIETNSLTGQGCKVEIPAGTFIIGTPIHLKTGVSLVGQGRGATTLKLGNNVNLSVLQVGTDAAETGPFQPRVSMVGYANIEHLSIDGNASNQSRPCYGIHLAQAGHITINDVRITNTKSHLIVADNGSLSAPAGSGAWDGLYRFHDLDLVAGLDGSGGDAYGGKPVGIYLWGVIDSIVDGIDFNSTPNSYTAVYIRDSGDINLHDSMLSGNTTAGIVLQGYMNHINIHNNFLDPYLNASNPQWQPTLWLAGSCAACNIQTE